MLPSLRDPFDIARVTTLECVASWGTAAHRRFVRPLLTDPSPLVRAYAAWAVGELGRDHLQPVLQRRLKSERHPIPRTALHEVLFGLTGHDRHLQALLRSLSSVDHRVACFAAWSLRNCVTIATRESITAALRRAHKLDKRLGVREAAGRALYRIESTIEPHNRPLQPTSRKALVQKAPGQCGSRLSGRRSAQIPMGRRGILRTSLGTNQAEAVATRGGLDGTAPHPLARRRAALDDASRPR